MFRAAVVRAEVIIFLLLTAGLVACESGHIPTDPIGHAVPTTQFSGATAEDSVSWIGNVLEFADGDGVQWRYERDGSHGSYSEFRIYRNGALEATMRPVYDLYGNVTGNRLLDPGTGAWYDATTGGDIVDTGGSGGGGGDREPPIQMERWPAAGETCAYDEMIPQSCVYQYNAMQRAAWEAAWVGTGTAILFAVPGGQKIGVIAAGVFADRTAIAASRLADWIVCMW